MLLRNSLFNVAGLGAPLVAALFTIPPLIEGLGVARFGSLTLIWAIVSYAGLLDLGIGRALTLRIASLIAQRDRSSIPPAVSSSLSALLVLSLLVSVLMVTFAQVIDSAILGLGEEGVQAVIAAAVAVPFVVLSSAFRGVLEAQHKFGLVNLIRVPLGVGVFVAPLLAILTFGPNLALAAWSLTIMRIVSLVPMTIATSGYRWWKHPPERSEISRLLTTGGWLSVTSVVAPLMNYLDRFALAALASSAAVAFYVTPQEMITKVWIIPGAITAVLFPVFAAHRESGETDALRTYYKATLVVALTTGPICVLIAIFSHQLLAIWIDATFADASHRILSLLCLGAFFSSIAGVPVTYLQSTGAAPAAAKLALVELPLVAVGLYFAIPHFGAEGAAWLWVARTVGDGAILFLMAERQLRESHIVASV